MDDIKDIERNDSISRLLVHKSLRIRPFGHNVSGERAYRRAERLVAGIHLVTNHIPPSEPVRAALRRTGLDLLSTLLLCRDTMRAPGSAHLGNVHALLRKLVSLVRMVSASGLLSLQNAELLIEALDELGAFLTASQKTPFSESVAITRVALLDAEHFSPHGEEAEGRKRQTRGLKEKIGSELQKTSNRAERTRLRSDSILTVLKGKEAIGIKDVVAYMPEYSEKMIQRELKSLVASGKVLKSGAKRWSMYTLAQ